MMATRKTFVDANNQHRPEDAWLVIGEPSNGILILNFWVSEIATDREDSTALAELELRAARARRFFHSASVYHRAICCAYHTFGSSMSSFSHSWTAAADMSCWCFVMSVYFGAVRALEMEALYSRTCSLTSFTTNHNKPIFLASTSLMLHLECLEPFNQLLVDNGIGRS
jgi:hypothetical protein